MLVQDDVFWFQISINYIKFLVQVTKSKDDLRSYEFDLVFREPSLDFNVIEKFSS